MNSPLRREATAKIINKKGLHARASAKIVEAAARFSSHITVTKDGQTVDARSISSRASVKPFALMVDVPARAGVYYRPLRMIAGSSENPEGGSRD
jgi:hypothetical protein